VQERIPKIKNFELIRTEPHVRQPTLEKRCGPGKFGLTERSISRTSAREDAMKMLLRMVMDATKGSEAIKSGAMQKAIGDLIEKLKPEAAYFATDRGMRAGFMVFEMKSANQQVEIAEPLFDLGCEIHLTPCMSPEDLQAGFAAAGRQMNSLP
jgi:hypothetical protein